MNTHTQTQTHKHTHTHTHTHTYRLETASLVFLQSLSILLESAIFPPEELIPGDVLHIIMRGVAIKDVRVHISGSLWGEDMILADPKLRRTQPGRAITYVEAYFLKPEHMETLCGQYPVENARIRFYLVRMAIARKIVFLAKETKLVIDLLRVRIVESRDHGIPPQQLFDAHDIYGDGTLLSRVHMVATCWTNCVIARGKDAC